MPVPTAISSLSQTAASNSPPGTESPTSADDYLRQYSAFIATLRDGKGHSAEVDLASAATCDIGGQNSLFVRVTGTTTITSFGTTYNGPRFVRFAGALTLTHNASSLILPGAANIVTAAGDACVVVPLAAGWQVVVYQRAAIFYGNAPAFSAYASATASIANDTLTKVVIDTEEFDTNSCFDTALNRFTPTTPGYYFFSGTTNFTTLGASNDRFGKTYLYKNGANFKAGSEVNLSTTRAGQGMPLSALVYMNGTTDYAEMFVQQNSGGALTLSGGSTSTFFSAHLARPA